MIVKGIDGSLLIDLEIEALKEAGRPPSTFLGLLFGQFILIMRFFSST